VLLNCPPSQRQTDSGRSLAYSAFSSPQLACDLADRLLAH
jgi:hypothetical protein